MRLLNINEIDPVNFSFSINAAFKFYWVDNRVQINDSSLDQKFLKEHPIRVDLEFMKSIWLPDFYFYDLSSLRTIARGGLRVKKRSNSNDTQIQYLVEWEVAFKCPIDYGQFPFHSATCNLRIWMYKSETDGCRLVIR